MRPVEGIAPYDGVAELSRRLSPLSEEWVPCGLAGACDRGAGRPQRPAWLA